MPFLLRVEKQYLKFSSAHFTLFPNGRETLHGHNYCVSLEVEAERLIGGMVVDFGPLKKAARAICDRWDEKILLPQSQRVAVAQANGETSLTVDESGEYRFPADEALILPIENVTCESLAWQVAQEVLQSRAEWDPTGSVRRLRVWVEETPGQQGGYEAVLDSQAF